MKQLTTPNYLSGRTVFQRGLLLGVALWLLAQVPISIVYFIYDQKSELKQHEAQRAAVQRILTEQFIYHSRFGDLVNAREATLRFGAIFGLIDLGLCREDRDILPRPMESRCVRANPDRIRVQIQAGDPLELDYHWTQPPSSRSGALLRALALGSALSLVLIIGSIAILSFLLSQQLSAVFSNLAKATTFTETIEASNEVLELRPVGHALADARKQLQDEMEISADLRTKAALGHLAAQVAHDIKSPLAALDSIERDIGSLPEQTRTLLRSAVARIKDIANDLLNRDRHFGKTQRLGGAEQSETVLLSSIVEQIVSEKRLQFRDHMGVSIHLSISSEGYGHFVVVNVSDFKRAISNLINNAVEADADQITVEVKSEANAAMIWITDNGKGIPPTVLATLGLRGVTHDKPGGSGLGLNQARTCFEKWQGCLELSSKIGVGTMVWMRLPKAPPPPWFVETLTLAARSKVIIIDDDSTIHQVWRAKFQPLDLESHQIELHHFLSPSAYTDWLETNEPLRHMRTNKCLLVDFEFLGSNCSGLDFIETVENKTECILVTSRFEQREILNKCLKLGIRVIPKSMASIVPVQFKTDKKELTLVLIDDDPLIHLIWKQWSQKNSNAIEAFFNVDDFKVRASELNPRTKIFIDSNLENGQKGEIVAKQIFDSGFKTIYLCTGSDPTSFGELPHISKIVGKEPPAWILKD